METSIDKLFVPVENFTEEEGEEKIIRLNFAYGDKNYTSSIDAVKEITDFPFHIPFPHETSFLGVFNMRGAIVPIFDPLSIALASPREGKLRLIVFEIQESLFIAIPATRISKVELSKDQIHEEESYITMDGQPYQCFDLAQFIKEKE